ncbi:DUF4365 domain-containing protein [Chitinophaga agri]|uniref:DUF4365 domain-containing protein n=1 Tax=Chitinophaga agri TaxID=2703787 RepID=A0A6B9ZDL5_9BACT|nr:DUF4365 domain-containing protein [Chitinophaga agri]QHS59849.1 DUF4365 domain-containing protein [Chitinophaga agri]
MLTENKVKEHLSIAYVKAVAAACNFACEDTTTDFDSVDVTITCNGWLVPGSSTVRSPDLKIQLKATENLTLNANSDYPFSLPLKNYDDLRANVLSPRILVVLHLPSNRIDWLSHSPNDLIIRNCAYYVNLNGLPDSANTTNVTIYLPSVNIFSPSTLTDLMIKVSKQQRI